MRGKQKLYTKLVTTSIKQNGEQGKRNADIEDRRDAMAHRYYFHAIISRKRYDDCLLNLNKEFWIQPNTIITELQKRSDLINKLNRNKVTTAELRKKYPFFNWVNKIP
jgi:HD superfamily phosphohydrolase